MLNANEVCFSVEGLLFTFQLVELCNASPYFEAMLNGNFSENKKDCIVLEETNANLFTIIHEWITLKKINITNILNDKLLQLLIMVDRFFLAEMISFCNQEIVRRLHLNQVTEVTTDIKICFHQFFEAAVLIENRELMEECVSWCLSEMLHDFPNNDFSVEELVLRKNKLEGFLESEEFNKSLTNFTKPAADVMYKMVNDKIAKQIGKTQRKIEIKKRLDMIEAIKKSTQRLERQIEVYERLIVNHEEEHI